MNSAQRRSVPSTLVVACCIEELGVEAFNEGDVVIHNDPYRGNCHMPEHMVMKPVFFDGELVAFVATIAHMAEVGGKAPGGFAADAMDVYQEGLRLPPVKLMERGERNEDVWKLILMNHRTPRSTWGDLHAMVGALNVGEQRLQSLFWALRNRSCRLDQRCSIRLFGAPDA